MKFALFFMEKFENCFSYIKKVQNLNTLVQLFLLSIGSQNIQFIYIAFHQIFSKICKFDIKQKEHFLHETNIGIWKYLDCEKSSSVFQKIWSARKMFLEEQVVCNNQPL